MRNKDEAVSELKREVNARNEAKYTPIRKKMH